MIYAYSMPGLGYPSPAPSGPSTGTIIGGGVASAIGAGLTIGMATGSAKRGGIAAAGATLLSLAPLAGPVAGAFMAVAGGVVTAMATMFKGCGASCTETSKVADQAAAAWKQIQDAYWAQSVRTKSSQSAALAALESIAGELQNFCANPAYGDAGKRCISERLVRGGPAPWCPTRTGCDFWTTIYDPIANDTGVVADPVSVQVAEALGVSGENSNLLMLGLLAGGLLLVGVML